jgi:antitoxin PrlF
MKSTMTSKGQITIPKEIREKLNLKAGSRVDFAVEKSGKITLKPLNWEWKSLRGMVKSPFKRPLTVREMDEAIAQEVLKSNESSRH